MALKAPRPIRSPVINYSCFSVESEKPNDLGRFNGSFKGDFRAGEFVESVVSLSRNVQEIKKDIRSSVSFNLHVLKEEYFIRFRNLQFHC